MTTTPHAPELEPVDYDATRDSRHPNARAARDQADWLLWLELGGLSDRTVADYQWATDRALKMFPSKLFATFTDGDLIHVLSKFPAPGRPARRAAFESWFAWGFQTRRLEENPMLRLPKVRRQGRKFIETYTEAEMERLCSLPLPDGALMRILFESGIRKSEARMLRPMDFKPDPLPEAPHGRLVIIDSKGGKDRVITCSKALKGALTELAMLENIEPRQHYWCGYKAGGGGWRKPLRDHPCGLGTFHRWWGDAVADAGVTYRKPHTSRHTYAVLWLRAGGRLETLSIQLGHTSIKVTYDYYGHLDARDVGLDLALIEASRL